MYSDNPIVSSFEEGSRNRGARELRFTFLSHVVRKRDNIYLKLKL